MALLSAAYAPVARPGMATSGLRRPQQPPRPSGQVRVMAQAGSRENDCGVDLRASVAAAAAGLLLAVSPAVAGMRLPPIDTDPGRCARGYVGNTIGQANAVSDKVLDLRKCIFSGKDLSGKTWSGALLADADLKQTKLQETIMTKAYAVGANFEGADMSSAVVDRVDFTDANLKNVKMVNAIITGANFNGANLDGVDFEDALIGSEDAKRLCLNPTLTGDSRSQVGCRT